jgi:hypothetical protein
VHRLSKPIVRRRSSTTGQPGHMGEGEGDVQAKDSGGETINN